MVLTLDPDRQVTTLTCDDCGGTREVVNGFIYRDQQPHAVYFAACYPSHHEAWIDVILGTWDDVEDDAAENDHVTFGCRVGPVEGRSKPACTLVLAASAAPEPSPIFGEILDRDQALKHPWLATFWEAVDFVLLEDPTVHPFMYDATLS